ncbi:MAG: hypothetical protein K0U54_08365 [Bacteroidetes bacterium]|nr:hypothetical protein [Bacteroidota bacterium]
MNIVNNISLVDWGMGTTIIIIFGLFCVILTAIIYSMVQSGKDKNDK